MENCTVVTKPKLNVNRLKYSGLTLGSQPALRKWITPHELEALSEALVQGGLPPDFLRKLRELALGGLSHQYIDQHCRLFAVLLLAAEHGAFNKISRAERDRLLGVLAYVRKDADAIPDGQADGFADDQREVHTAVLELADLLRAFKAWRLRFQVPAMWSEHALA